MANGQLEKMKIYAYNNPELSAAHQVGQPFVAMMNPETYAIDKKMEFNLKQGHGTSGHQPKFELKLPEEMSFEFLFDNTGIIDGQPSTNLTQKIDDFSELLMGYNGSTHEPKFFKLVWGTLLFKGRCTAMERGRLEAVMGWLHSQRRPLLVQLPDDAYRKVEKEWRLPPH